MTDLPEKKKQLAKKDRALINWFIWDHLELDTSPTRDRSKWDQPYQSMYKGDRGWWPIQQGHTGIHRLLYWYQNIYRIGSKEWRPAIIIRAALVTANGVKATEYLSRWLSTYHPHYTTENVAISPCRGYLRCMKPCGCTYPPFDGYTLFVASGKIQPHYHTIGISGIKGFGRGMYAFWRALKAGGIIPMASETVKGGDA